ncbi:uncharacterized protein LOC143357070 [Halictus rubicundus]|uniref:uncharacterized protein LOC143357070 n=1 Tax=Halictus rubicundus TaxID=77578 RepID=UPI004036D858
MTQLYTCVCVCLGFPDSHSFGFSSPRFSQTFCIKLHITSEMSKWNRRRLMCEIKNGEDAIRWTQNQNLLPKTRYCKKHRKEMTLHLNRHGIGTFRCKTKTKQHEITITKNTFFENSHLSLGKIYSIMYSFCHTEDYEKCRHEAWEHDVDGEISLSDRTICDYYNLCRNMIVDDYFCREELRGRIGGPGKIVQIDRSEFGKAKYIRGKHIDGHWVLGMIENDSEDFRAVVCPENVGDSKTLIAFIKQHVIEGTEIHTDASRAYSALLENGYTHKIVTRSDSVHRVVADGETHTQRIQATMRSAKNFFKSKNVPSELFIEYLIEYQWRRECQKLNIDPFEDLIKCIRLAFPL